VPGRLLPLLLLLLLGCPGPTPNDDDATSSDDDDSSSIDDDDDLTPPPPSDCLGARPEDELILTDVAAEAGVQGITRNMAMAAEDWDGDGDVDLFLTGGSPARLYLNQGDGTFAQLPDPPDVEQGTGASTPDYDGDGDPDLYVSCGQWGFGCTGRLFRNDGADGEGLPVFVDVTGLVGLLDEEPSGFGGNWADFDGDGDLDLLQTSKQLPMDLAPPEDLLYRNDGGVFVEVGGAAGLASVDDHHMGVWLDFDEDGHADVFAPAHGGPNQLFRNQGDGSFVEVTPAEMIDPDIAFAAAAADVDNDGHVDLLANARWRPETGDDVLHGLWLSDGAAGWTDARQTTGFNDPGLSSSNIETMGMHVVDLDQDGYLEVIFGTGDPGQAEVNAMGSFLPDGEGGVLWLDRSELIDQAPEPADGLPPYPYRSHGMVAFDYDEDGDVDLFMGNGGGEVLEPVRLWRNDSPGSNRWIRVALDGEVPGGVGARVRVADGPEGLSSWAVHRFAWRTAGFNSTLPRTLRIGLGRCDGPYHVTVTWADRSTTVVDGALGEERITIVQDG
jgi:hypothetical protein